MLDAGFELEFFQGGTTTDVLSIQIAAAGTRQAGCGSLAEKVWHSSRTLIAYKEYSMSFGPFRNEASSTQDVDSGNCKPF